MKEICYFEKSLNLILSYVIYKYIVDLFHVRSCFAMTSRFIRFFFLDILRGPFYPNESSWAIGK